MENNNKVNDTAKQNTVDDFRQDNTVSNAVAKDNKTPAAEAQQSVVCKKTEKGMKGLLKEAMSWILTIFLAVVAAKLINNYAIIKAEVPTGSMEHTIEVNDCIIGFQQAYLFSKPKRGDIIIFPYPDEPETIYVKRIIGLPGETVEIKNGFVYIDGTPIEEPYLKEEMLGEYGPYVVPEGCYFMLGDNRNLSLDSRKWNNPYVKEEDIMAKVLFRYSPSFQWYFGIDYE